MTGKNYQEQRDIDAIEKLRSLRHDLPFICNEYFIGIQNVTSPLTRLGYAHDLLIFFDFLLGEIPEFEGLNKKTFCFDDLGRVTSFHIELFLDYIGHYRINGREHNNSLKTKARKLSAVKAFFKYFYNKDYIKSDPAAKVMTPKLHDKPIVRLDEDEVVNLLDEVESGNSLSPRQKAFHEKSRLRDTAIVTLFLGTGIRISELVGLNVADFDFNDNSFKITRKGGNETILYFSQEVKYALLDYLDERAEAADGEEQPEAMFLSLRGSRLTVRSVENLVEKYAGVSAPLKKITPHKLRSTYGTALYRQTGDIYVVAEVLGHKDINTTKKHYAAIGEDIKRSASTKVRLRKDKDE